MKKENQIGIAFLVLVPVSFFVMGFFCPMFESSKYMDASVQGSAIGYSCGGLPIYAPLIFILPAVYFFWKATKK